MEKNNCMRIPFAGFYNSYWSALIDMEIESEYQWRKENGVEENPDEELNYEDAQDYICRKYVDGFMKLMEEEYGLKLDLTFECMTSPKYYNFESDHIHVNISDEDMKKIYDKVMEPELREEFIRYTIKEYSPRDGHMPYLKYAYGYCHWDLDNLDDGHYYIMLEFLYERLRDDVDVQDKIEYLACPMGFYEGIHNALFN